MKRHLATKPKLWEITAFFVEFLQEMTQAVSQVKTEAYSLLDLPTPSSKQSLQISPDPIGIMDACKRTLDDMRRVESVLRGRSRGKNKIIESDNSGMRIVPPLTFIENSDFPSLPQLSPLHSEAIA